MRNPLNTSKEDRKDIERLTVEMIQHIVNAQKNINDIPKYFICMAQYNKVIEEAERKEYKDIVINSFPKPVRAIDPDIEREALIYANKWVLSKNTILSTGYMNKLHDICKGV